MGVRPQFTASTVMASPWRRRRMCILTADQPALAALREISAVSAFLETNARPALGASVELSHPEAGEISGIVQGISRDGIKVGFDCSEISVAFALAAITADMSNPAA